MCVSDTPFYDQIKEEIRLAREESVQVGDVWLQPIDEILTRWSSTDGGSPEPSYYDEEVTCWDEILDEKRDDSHYPDVVASLRERGWVRPATCWGYPWEMVYGDGHHRLAAAIDLGHSEVLIERHPKFCIAPDSGEWDSSDPIPLRNAA